MQITVNNNQAVNHQNIYYLSGSMVNLENVPFYQVMVDNGAWENGDKFSGSVRVLQLYGLHPYHHPSSFIKTESFVIIVISKFQKASYITYY